MKVKFMPQDVELEIAPNQSVLDLAQKNDIFIKTVCNGMPSCAECRVKIIDGEHNVLPPSSKELQLIGTGHFIDRRRLSCQLQCFGDITIDLSEQSVKKDEGPPGTRKFQQDIIKQGGVSRAVNSTLLEEDHEIVEQVTKQKERPHRRPQKGGRNRNRNNRNRRKNKDSKDS